jgi:DNA-binding beta-propeller fold protein YncE
MQAGLWPLHAMILKTLPTQPEPFGVAGKIGNGIGNGDGQFNHIGQFSFSQDGAIWAVDKLGHRVHHFKQSGELIKTIGSGIPGDGPGELSGPTGIAVSRLSSSIFISEGGNHRISQLQSDGAFLRILPTPGLGCPGCISLSPDEKTLAVVGRLAHCIKLVQVDGTTTPKTIGVHGSRDGQFNLPCDVCFTPDGQQLVVADLGNHRVQVLSLDGTFVRKIQLGDDARAVAVDAAGNIIATTTQCVKVLSPDGRLLHEQLGGGFELGEFAVAGLAIDPGSGRIAAACMGAGLIRLL